MDCRGRHAGADPLLQQLADGLCSDSHLTQTSSLLDYCGAQENVLRQHALADHAVAPACPTAFAPPCPALPCPAPRPVYVLCMWSLVCRDVPWMSHPRPYYAIRGSTGPSSQFRVPTLGLMERMCHLLRIWAPSVGSARLCSMGLGMQRQLSSVQVSACVGMVPSKVGDNPGCFKALSAVRWHSCFDVLRSCNAHTQHTQRVQDARSTHSACARHAYRHRQTSKSTGQSQGKLWA